MNQVKLNQLKATVTNEPYLIDREEYFQSAVLVPLIVKNDEYHFVFEKRASGIRQGGEVCFPGGRMEATDKSLKMTALRETCEELGCSASSIEFLGSLGAQIIPTGVLVSAYLGILNESESNWRISEAEVAKVFTVPVRFFMENEPEEYRCKILVHPYNLNQETGEKEIFLPSEELDLPLKYREPWGEARHKIYAYPYEEELIWGITAKIIYHLVKKMKTGEEENPK